MKVYIGPYKHPDGQEIEVQIDRYDTWSLDYTLAHIIYPALKQFKEQKNGVPGAFIPEVDPYRDYTEEEFEQAEEAWNIAVDKMIWSFEQIVTGKVEDNYKKEYHKRLQEGLELFGKYYRNLWT